MKENNLINEDWINIKQLKQMKAEIFEAQKLDCLLAARESAASYWNLYVNPWIKTYGVLKDGYKSDWNINVDDAKALKEIAELLGFSFIYGHLQYNTYRGFEIRW